MKRIKLPIDGKGNLVKSRVLKSISLIETMKDDIRSVSNDKYKIIELGKSRKDTYQFLYMLKDYYDIEIEKKHKSFNDCSSNTFQFYAKAKPGMINEEILSCASLYKKYIPTNSFKGFELFTILNAIFVQGMFSFNQEKGLFMLEKYRQDLDFDYYYIKSKLLKNGVIKNNGDECFLNEDFVI